MPAGSATERQQATQFSHTTARGSPRAAEHRHTDASKTGSTRTGGGDARPGTRQVYRRPAHTPTTQPDPAQAEPAGQISQLTPPDPAQAEPGQWADSPSRSRLPAAPLEPRVPEDQRQQGTLPTGDIAAGGSLGAVG